MKTHLPLNLLAALMASFSSVTLGTATMAGLVCAIAAQAEDVTFDGAQKTVPASGSVTWDTAAVTASTTLEFAGEGAASITHLNGAAGSAVLKVNRAASAGAALSTLTLNGQGDFNGTIEMNSSTTDGSQNNILDLNHALAAQNASIKLSGHAYATGASVLKASVDTSIRKLEYGNAAALITGTNTTLAITGDSSSYGGSFGGTVTVDYRGGGTFLLGNSTKDNLNTVTSADATLKISSGTLSLNSGVVTWSQKLVMGDNTNINMVDGANLADGTHTYDAASINSNGYTFSGGVSFGSNVNLTSTWGKMLKFSGVLTAANGFTISGGANENAYFNLLNDLNSIGGTIAITRDRTSLGVSSSGSLGDAAVTTSSNSQYITYYGVRGGAADVIDNSITGAGNFVAHTGWVHLGEAVALAGTYTVNSGATLSRSGSINAVLAGGTLDAGAGSMTVTGLSGNGMLSASAGNMNFQGQTAIGASMGILVNGAGSITGDVTVDGGRLYYTADMAGASTVLAGVKLTSGLIDFSRFEAFQALFGKNELIGTTYDLGADLGSGFALVGVDASAYTITLNDEGRSIITFTSTGFADVSWSSAWGIADAPATAYSMPVTTQNVSLYHINSASLQPEFGSVNMVTGSGALTGVKLAGGYFNDSTAGNGTVITTDIWTDVKGGSYSLIIGGSYANNWNWAVAEAWNVTGDIHTQIEGNTSVDWVIGGNYGDAHNATVTGDVYTSVMGDAVIRGSLIGGGTATHAATNRLVGSTHVVIGNVQSVTDASLALGSVVKGAIIGGSAYEGNVNSAASITGSTNVTIDLGGDAAGSFVKTIYGGSYAGSTGAYSIGGDSNVSITSSNGVIFSGNIYGASFAGGGAATVAGNSTVTINGGRYTGDITAGGQGANSSVDGDATLILKRGIFGADEDASVTFYASAANGAVKGKSTLIVGGYGSAEADSIVFGGFAAAATVDGFDIVKLHQNSRIQGDLLFNDSFVLALVSGGDAVHMAGALVLQKPDEEALNLDLTEFADLQNGDILLTLDYGLHNFSSIRATFADGIAGIVTISTPEEGMSVNLVFEEKPLLTWAGGASADWNAADVWSNKGSAAAFAPGDGVLFSDQAGINSSTVTLKQEVAPVVATVNNTTTRYELTGPGSLTGIDLIKKGSGTLVIGAANILGTGTTIDVEAGVLAFGYNTAVPATGILWGAGSFLGSANGATVTVDLGTMTPAFSLSPEAGSFIDLVVAANKTFDLNIAGEGTVLKTGAGVLTLTGANDGHIDVEAGELQIGNITTSVNWGGAGSSVTLQTGTTLQISGKSDSHHKIGSNLILGVADSDAVTIKWYDASASNEASYQYDFSGNVTVNGSALLTYNNTNSWAKEIAFTGELTGGGTLTYNRGTGDNIYNANGKVVIKGDASEFSGNIILDAVNGNSAGLDLFVSMGKGTVTLNSDTGNAGKLALMRIMGNVEIAALNSNAGANSHVGAVGGARTLTVGSGTYNGILTDKGVATGNGTNLTYDANGILSLTKVSDKTLTLGGTVNYTGATNIQGGTLALTTSGATTLGNISMAAGTRMTTVGALNMAAGSSLTLDAASSMALGGAFGGGTFDLTLTGLDGLKDSGEITLISALGGLDGTTATFNWSGYAGDGTMLYELAQTANSLKLIVTSLVDVWIWQNTPGMTWSDSNTGEQWGLPDSAATAAGQSLVFNSNGAGIVTLSGTVTPAKISVTNAKGSDYEFKSDGTGKIASGSLIKKGEGRLTLDLDNTGWTGSISVGQGELIAKAAHSLGGGEITVEGGTLTLATAQVQDGMGKLTLESGMLNLESGNFTTAFTAANMVWTGGSLQMGADVIATVDKTLANGKTVALGDKSLLTIAGSNDNAALNLNASGSGTIIVNLDTTSYGNNVLNLSTAFQGTLSVGRGYFQLNNITMGADAVLELTDSNVRTEWNGAADGTFANDIKFIGNQLFATKNVTLSGNLSGVAFSTQGSGNLTLTGGIDLSGQLKVHKGTVTVNSASVARLGDSIDIQNNAVLAFARSFTYSGIVSGTAGSILSARAGVLELTGANTFLGALAIDKGATASLGNGSAWAGSFSGEGKLLANSTGDLTFGVSSSNFTGETTLAGAGKVILTNAQALGSGKVTINNGTLDMGGLNVGNNILITKGNLANAGGKATGGVEIAAAVGASASARNTINLGGLSSDRVSSLTTDIFTRVTGINGVLDMTGKTVSLKLDSGNLSTTGGPGVGVVDGDGLTLSAATTTISLNNQAVLDVLAANRQSPDGVGLALTTGTLSIDNPKGITFSPLLTGLGYAVAGENAVQKGTLFISGNTDLTYLVDTSSSSDNPRIDSYATFDPYKMVGINNATMTVSLSGAPDASRNGEGLQVKNLVGSNASLIVTNTAANANANHVVVDLVQNIDAGGNSYGGTISGDYVDFVKKGAETLTVDGNVTGTGSILRSQEGEIVLNGAANNLESLGLAGGDITLGGRLTTVKTLGATLAGGTLTLQQGAELAVAGQAAANTVGNMVIAGGGTLSLGTAAANTSLVLASGSSLNGVLLNIRTGSALTMAAGSTNTVSGLTGNGALSLNGASMTANLAANQTFTGTLDGASGTLNIQSANGGMQTISGAGNAGYTLNVRDGGRLTLGGIAAGEGQPLQASYRGITVNGGSLNIGSDDSPKTRLTLGSGGMSVTGDSTVTITTSSKTVDGLGAPFVTSSGNITLGDNTGTVTLVTRNLDALVSGSDMTLNLELFRTTGGATVSLGSDVILQDMILGSLYQDLVLTTNDTMTSIIVTGEARTANIFLHNGMTANSSSGAELLWGNRFDMSPDSPLRNLYTSVLQSQQTGDLSGAARKLAAAAGSTVTSLGIAQRDGMRDQMLWVRNRVTQMGANPAYVNADMPYFHMWMQGTGSYAQLDTSGDESGYKLTSWGGTVGMDVDVSDNLTLGAAFTANYGRLTASAADTADGDLDSYYANLFARYQSGKWSHMLVLTGGWNDASLTRSVDYDDGSYSGRGTTSGSGFGAMYELAYDIALNENKSAILQPLFNASVVTTRMDGYNESGTGGNAGLRVEDQKLTTAALAAGVRLSGLVGSNIFGREALGEVRVNVSQDMGDRRGKANVGFLANPAFTRPVYGAKAGATAFQVGAGLSVPVGYQSIIFMDGNADIRSGSSSVNGSIGWRYNF